MELFIFGRFHAKAGREAEVEATIREVVPQSRAEAGCLGINAFRSTRDARLFYIYSRWRDGAAFEHHAAPPHTVRFIERIEKQVDHPLDISRATQFC
jgi:quinol monooxygenase YgiN